MQAPCANSGARIPRSSSAPSPRAFAAAALATARRRRPSPPPSAHPPSSSSPAAAPSSAPSSEGAALPDRWPYSTPVQRVRDYELDAYRVVNNGVYAHLFQDARHLALERLCGTSVGDYLEMGVLMALSELVVRYRSPLRSGDAYVSRVGVLSVGGARVTLSQQVVRVDATSGEPLAVAADGSATVVFLDGEYRPARMPREAREAFERALAEAAAAGEPGGSKGGGEQGG